MNEWLSTRDAAKLTGYVVEYIRQLAREGKIVSKKYGQAVVVSRDSLLEYKEKQEEEREERNR